MKIITNRFDQYVTGLFVLLFIGTTIRWTTTTVEILVFIFTVGLYFVKRNHNPLTFCFSKEQKYFFYALIFVLFSYMLTFILGKGWELESIKRPGYPSLTDLDIPVRYFLGIFVFLLFVRLSFKIDKRKIQYAVVAGGIVNGAFAMYERYILGMQRVDGFVGIAEMGTASSLLCLFNTIFFVFSASKKEKIFFLISSLFAFAAAFSTVARSAMVSLVIAMCVLFIILVFKSRANFKKIIIPLGGMLIIFSLLWSFPVTKDTFRLQEMQTDLSQYTQNNPQTSIGMRFEMWKEALAMFEMSPIYGMSTAMIARETNRIIEKSGSRIREGDSLGVRGTKHSQIMEALAKRGAVGLLALLLFWWTSLKMFGHNLRNSNDEILKFKLCGFLGIFYFIFINSFTGEPWDSMVDTPMILLLCALFVKFIQQEENEKQNLSHHSC